MPVFKIQGTDRSLDKLPNQCPICHYHISPLLVDGRQSKNHVFQIAYQCTHCFDLFIGYYRDSRSATGTRYYLSNTKPNSVITKEFTEEITNISPQFSEIYNQANHAESLGLSHICGPGYRKALEFLIKDYLINQNPEKEEFIKDAFLGRCIRELVTDPNIKACAERAVWLGNDETHYVREWEGMELKHMKELIDLTIHWISSEIITRRYLSEMSK